MRLRKLGGRGGGPRTRVEGRVRGLRRLRRKRIRARSGAGISKNRLTRAILSRKIEFCGHFAISGASRQTVFRGALEIEQPPLVSSVARIRH